MKLLLTSLTLALLSSTASSAAPDSAEPLEAVQPAVTNPQALELARQFVGLTVSADQYIDVMNAGARQAVSAKLGDVEDASLDEGLDQFLALIAPTVREQMPNLREAYAQAYAREFSASELQNMLSFAATPAGRHFFARSTAMEMDPQVLNMQEVMGAAIMPAIERAKKKMCAAKAAARMAAGDTKAKCPLSDPAPRAG